jgi:N-acetylmuramoyl-L-alanine amidase CwlA
MIENLIPSGTRRRPGLKRARTGFIVAHDTGNIDSTARENTDWYRSTPEYEPTASVHLFVDDAETILSVPLDEKAWHVRYNVPGDNEIFGDDANDISVGVELCYFRDRERSVNAYWNYVKVIADLCILYNMDPMKHIVGHYLLDPERRTDPENAFRRIDKNMNLFLVDVKNALPGQEGAIAIDKLVETGRLTSPGYWKELLPVVKNLEWVFIKWAKEVKE